MDGRREEVELAATLPLPAVGKEEPVISKDRWEELQQRRRQGQSVSQIARAMELDRKTVRTALAKAEWTS